VTPPTGKFIVQLFLVPGLIVGLIVCLLLLVYWLFGGPRSPESFLKKLDDTNAEVRWRAAADLSQVLPRDSRLASNVGFCLQLSERLERALRDSEPAEKAFLEQLLRLDAQEAQQQRARLDRERDYIHFLTGSLGHFLVPAGAPVLCRIIEQEPPLEPQPQAFRRRTAIMSLANLGDCLHKFDRLPSIEQNLILEQLRKLDETTQGEPKKWNHAALECLEKRKAGQDTTMGVDQALIKAAESEDPVSREFAAFALGFWKGDPAQNKRMEAALIRLASDNGRGRDRIEDFQGPEPGETREWLSQPGLIVQINATLSLLRLGSSKVRTGMVLEMLDEKKLGEEIQSQSKNGTRQPNQGKAAKIVESTLKALSDFYRKKPAEQLSGVPDQGIDQQLQRRHPDGGPGSAQVLGGGKMIRLDSLARDDSLKDRDYSDPRSHE